MSRAARDLYLVVGIRSNFRELLPAALECAERHGFNARILDVGGMVGGWRNYPNDWAELELDDRTLYVRSLSEFESFRTQADIRSAVFLFLYLPDRHLRPLWRSLQRGGARVGAIVAGPVPSFPAGKKASRHNLLRRLSLFLKRQLKPRPDFWITSGTICGLLYSSYFRTLKNVPEIRAHSIDYERKRRQFRMRGDANDPGRRIVLLDQGWFSKPRPDFLDESSYPPTNADDFARDMRRYLDYLGTRTGLEVSIACHPKADLTATRSLFDGFDVSKGDTGAMVDEAAIVIANSTTSIQYAVIRNVPLILFTSQQLSNSIVQPLFDGYRWELNPATVFIDDPDTYAKSIEGLAVDREAYARFMNRYIRHEGAPDEPMWEIAFRGLAGLLGS